MGVVRKLRAMDESAKTTVGDATTEEKIRQSLRQKVIERRSVKENRTALKFSDARLSSSNVFMIPTGENFRPVQQLLNENRQQVVACTSQTFLPWM